MPKLKSNKDLKRKFLQANTPRPTKESEATRKKRRKSIFGERGAKAREAFLRPLKKRK